MIVVHLSDFSFVYVKDNSDILKLNQNSIKCRIFPSLMLLISPIKDSKQGHKILEKFVACYVT